MSSLLICIIISVSWKYNSLIQEKLIVYNNKYPYIEYVRGKASHSPDTIPESHSAQFQQYTLRPAHLTLGVQNALNDNRHWHTFDAYDLFSLRGKKVLRIKDAHKLQTRSKVEVDYLILSDKWIKEPKRILNHIKTKELIIDGNIPLWKIAALKSQLQEVALPTHYVALDGPKIIPL